jgi:hypothetical protein
LLQGRALVRDVRRVFRQANAPRSSCRGGTMNFGQLNDITVRVDQARLDKLLADQDLLHVNDH